MSAKQQVSKGKIRVLLNMLSDPAILIDEKGCFLMVNDEFEKITGLSWKQIAGKCFLEIENIPDESKAVLLENLKKRIQGASIATYEAYFIDKTGVKRCIEVKGKRVSYQGHPADLVVFHDVTLRKQNQQCLKEYAEQMEKLVEAKVKEILEREQQFRSIFENSIDGVLLTKPDGSIEAANPRACQMLGMTEEEIKKAGREGVVVKEKKLAAALKEREKTGKVTAELTFKRKDGSTFIGEITSALFTGADGETYSTVIFRDISERKKTQDAIRQERDMLGNITANIGAGLAIIDKNYTIVWANNFLKYYLGNIEGKPCYAMINGLGAPCSHCDAAKIFAEETTIDVHECQSTDAKGDPLWTQVVTTPFRDSEGKIVAIAEILVDITAQKQTQQQLKESEEAFRAICTCAEDAIIVVNQQGEVVYWNPAAEHIFGYSQEEAIGKNVLNLIHPSRHNANHPPFMDLIKSGWLLKGKTVEIIAKRKGGKEFHAELSASNIKFKDKMCLLGIVRDISERKEAEAKLRASERKYRTLYKELKTLQKRLMVERDRAQNYLDVAVSMLVALDTKGRITLLNRKACAILKCTPEEALGKNWFDTFLPKDTKDNVKKAFNASIKKGKCLLEHNENYVIPKNGEPRLIKWHNTLLKDKQGKVIGALSSGEDITEWKKTQQALIDSEERFRAISTCASDAVILLNKDDEVVYWNPAAEKIFGYTKEEAVGKKLNDLIVPPKNRETRVKNIQNLLGNKQQASLTEITAVKKDGTEFPIELSMAVLCLRDGEYVLEIIRDVSERKRMEDALKRERDLLEAVTANVGAGLGIISRDYRILWVNKYLQQVFPDGDGKTCYSTFNHLTTVCPDCGVRKVFEDGVILDRHEYAFTGIDGKPMWAELIATPIRDEKGKVVAALELTVDITEKKQLQNKLKEYSEKLERLVEQRTAQLQEAQAKLLKAERLAAIGELSAMVGHDLRNPLTAIKNVAFYLKKKGDACPADQKEEMLNIIDNAIDRANKIVNDLLEYSREIRLEPTPCTPTQLLAEALKTVNIPDKIKLIDKTCQEPLLIVDAYKMVRVFVNLIKNAVEAMPDGGTLTIKTRRKADAVEITFADTGVGIPEEVKAKLFNPLVTTKAQGMGFGLAICKRIIDAHQGVISVESTIGKGATFTIKLPLKPKLEVGGEKEWQSILESSLSMTTPTLETR